jgi:hypothetical protein
MTCYSNGCKSMCAKVTVGVSCLIALMGIITCAFGAMQLGVLEGPTEFISFEMDNSNVGKGILGLGAVCFITGVLGCLTAKFKKPWFATLFIALCLLVGLVLLIVGALAAFGGAIYDAVAEVACQADNTYDSYKNAVDKKMCSDDCRCNEDYKSLW